MGGALLTKIESGTSTYFHQDHLSNRVLTDSNGNVVGQLGSYPWGEQWYSQNTTTKWTFTTYERDSESSNDYALARYYVNRFGRFLSTDPLSGNPANPQSQNLYTYSGNDPINKSDPTGLLYWFVIPYIPHTGIETEFEDLLPWIVNPNDPEHPWSQGWNPQAVQAPDIGLPPWMLNPPNLSLLLGPTPQPPPPPGYEECKAALAAAGQSFDALQRALDNWGTLKDAAWNAGVPTQILAAVAIRESGMQNLPQIGGGQGLGWFQIDQGQNPGTQAIATDLQASAQWAANLLGTRFRNYVNMGYDLGYSMAGAVHDYNERWNQTVGLLNLARNSDWLGYLDVGLTNPQRGNWAANGYVTNVLQIATNCF